MNEHDSESGSGLPTLEQMAKTGPWRSDSQLVVLKGVPLPAWCIKSGELADTCFVRTMVWGPLHTWLWLFMFPFLPRTTLRIIGESISSATMYIPVTAEWMTRRRIILGIGVLLVVLGGCVLPIMAVLKIGSLSVWLLGVVLSLVIVIIGLQRLVSGSGLVQAARITDDLVWLNGVSPHFLAKVPNWNAVTTEPNGDAPAAKMQSAPNK